jgi:hypothetical protein
MNPLVDALTNPSDSASSGRPGILWSTPVPAKVPGKGAGQKCRLPRHFFWSAKVPAKVPGKSAGC